VPPKPAPLPLPVAAATLPWLSRPPFNPFRLRLGVRNSWVDVSSRDTEEVMFSAQ
jgi:hypothetical protein